MLERSFAYGQGPTQACASANPVNRAGVAFWMGVGTVQFIAFGLSVPLARLVSAEYREVQKARPIDVVPAAEG